MLGTSRWSRKSKSVFGIALPSDYIEFCLRYGSGYFVDPGRLSIRVLNCMSTVFLESLESFCDVFRDISTDELGFDVYPQNPGLFPIVTDDSGGNICWLTTGTPTDWPLLSTFTRELFVETHHLPLTTFLAECFSRKVDCNIWRHCFLKREGLSSFHNNFICSYDAQYCNVDYFNSPCCKICL